MCVCISSQRVSVTVTAGAWTAACASTVGTWQQGRTARAVCPVTMVTPSMEESAMVSTKVAMVPPFVHVLVWAISKMSYLHHVSVWFLKFIFFMKFLKKVSIVRIFEVLFLQKYRNLPCPPLLEDRDTNFLKILVTIPTGNTCSNKKRGQLWSEITKIEMFPMCFDRILPCPCHPLFWLWIPVINIMSQ